MKVGDFYHNHLNKCESMAKALGLGDCWIEFNDDGMLIFDADERIDENVELVRLDFANGDDAYLILYSDGYITELIEKSKEPSAMGRMCREKLVELADQFDYDFTHRIIFK